MVTRSPIVLESGQTFDRSQALNLVTSGSGVKAGSQTVVEKESIVRRTVITIPSQAVAMVDATTNGSQGSLELYDFPAKRCQILAAQVDAIVARVGTNITATAALVAAIGTAVPGADATLTSTEANIVPSSTATLVAGAGTIAGQSSAPLALAASQKAYLNLAIPDAGSAGNDSLTVAGTVTIDWIALP